MRTKALIAIASASALALTACGGGGGGSEGKDGGTVNLYLGSNPASLLPPDTTESEGGKIVDSVYAGLIEYDENGESENVVAKSIESEDNKTWTIELEEGFTFHNGEDVDAEAFKRAWDWGAYGPNAATGNYFYDRIEGFDDVSDAEDPEAEELSGVEADGYTLTVTLTEAWVGFSEVLGYSSYMPMAEECVEDTDACNSKPIGNGPFEFDGEWKQEEQIVLKRFDDFGGDKPKVDKIDYTIYTGDDTCWADFQSGDIDICTPPVEEWEAAQNDPDLSERHISQPDTNFTYLGYPTFLEEYKDPKVRQALSLAVNREEVIDVALPGRAVPATSFSPENIPGGKEGTCNYCEFDPDEAKKLLDESDWDSDKIEIWYNSDPTNKAIFEAVGNQIQQNLGIDFELQEEEWDPYLDVLEKNEQTGPFRLGWIPDYPLNETYLKPVYGNGPDNNFGYHNEEFEAKLAEGDKADDLDSALASYTEAEEILGEDMPNIPLTFGVTSIFYSENILEDSVAVHPIGALQEKDLQLQ